MRVRVDFTSPVRTSNWTSAVVQNTIFMVLMLQYIMRQRPYIRQKYFCIKNEKCKDGKHNNRLAALLFAMHWQWLQSKKRFHSPSKWACTLRPGNRSANELDAGEELHESLLSALRSHHFRLVYVLQFILLHFKMERKRWRINSRTECILNLLFSSVTCFGHISF